MRRRAHAAHDAPEEKARQLYGEFTIDVEARKIDLEFSARFSTYDTTEHSY
jgi:hypothetical protein